MDFVAAEAIKCSQIPQPGISGGRHKSLNDERKALFIYWSLKTGVSSNRLLAMFTLQ